MQEPVENPKSLSDYGEITPEFAIFAICIFAFYYLIITQGSNYLRKRDASDPNESSNFSSITALLLEFGFPSASIIFLLNVEIGLTNQRFLASLAILLATTVSVLRYNSAAYQLWLRWENNTTKNANK